MKTDLQVEWCDSGTLLSRVAGLVLPASIVVDIGCGIHPQQFVVPDVQICVEPHHEYVEILKRSLAGTNSVVIAADAKTALLSFPDHSVDSIFLIDIIEHMVKEDGIELIRLCERVARQQIILFTPLGFMPQEVGASQLDGWNLHGGNFQDHKSGWYPEDFTGWHVIACKHLHPQDHKGNPIYPPYGGMYAIKSILKSENMFNDIYGVDILQTAVTHVPELSNTFYGFLENIVHSEIGRSRLKCALRSTHHTTQLLVLKGATHTVDEILTLAESEQTKFCAEEAIKYIDKIRKLANELALYNDLGKQKVLMAERNAELDERESALAVQESALAVQESALAGKIDKINNILIVRVLRRFGLIKQVLSYDKPV